MKPMLAVPSKGGNTTDGLEGWIADLKLDGLRCIADWDGREVTLELADHDGKAVLEI